MPTFDQVDEVLKLAKDNNITLRRGPDYRVVPLGSDGSVLNPADPSTQESMAALGALMRDPSVKARVYAQLPALSFQEKLEDIYQRSYVPNLVRGAEEKPGTFTGGMAALTGLDIFAPEAGLPLEAMTGMLGAMGGAEAAPPIEQALGQKPRPESLRGAAKEGFEYAIGGRLAKELMAAPELARAKGIPKFRATEFNKDMGDTIAALLDQPEISGQVRNGRSVWDILSEKTVREQAQSRYKAGIEALRENLEKKIIGQTELKLDAINEQARQKWGVDFLGKGAGRKLPTREMVLDPEYLPLAKQFRAARQAFEKAQEDAAQAGDEFQDFANFSNQQKSKIGHDKDGNLTRGSKTYVNVRSSVDAKKQVTDLLQKYDTKGDLLKQYEDINGQYGNWKTLERMRKDPRLFNFSTGELNSTAWQSKWRQLRGVNQSVMQPEAFDALERSINHGALPAHGTGTDLPGLIERGEALPFYSRGHISESGPGFSALGVHVPNVNRSKPLFSKYIGEARPMPARSVPGLVSKALASRPAQVAARPSSAAVIRFLNQGNTDETEAPSAP